MCLKDSGFTFTVEREREREGEVINELPCQVSLYMLGIHSLTVLSREADATR